MQVSNFESFYDFYSHSYWEVFCKIGVLKKQLVYKVVSSISSRSSSDIPVKKFIFRIILLILLERELLYNFEEFSSQFLKQLFLRTLTGCFSICIHVCGVSSNLIPFASLKKFKTTCRKALFLVKLRKVPHCKTHHISTYIVLCNNIYTLTPWSC